MKTITDTQRLDGRFAILREPTVVIVDGIVFAVCANQLAADRIAALLAEHGIADVPDAPA